LRSISDKPDHRHCRLLRTRSGSGDSTLTTGFDNALYSTFD
jgi:hypothetical protein